MLKFCAEPRFKIGDKMWIGIENQETGVIMPERALIVGYKIITVVTGFLQDMEVQYLVLVSALNHPEINVHEVERDCYIDHGDLFDKLIVDGQYIFYSEQEVPGAYVN